MKKMPLMVAIVLSAVFYGCTSGSGNQLQGCFSTEKDGKAELKIENQDNKFYASLRRGKKWTGKTALHEGKDDELQSLFKDDAKKIKASLINNEGGFGIFHVNPDEQIRGQKLETEYFAFMMFSVGSAHKVQCEK